MNKNDNIPTVYRQGSLDNMCAVYAIMNSLSCCGLKEKQIQNSFLKSVNSFTGLKFLTEGYYLSPTIQNSIKSIDLHQYGISVTYPFVKYPPRSDSEFWERYAELFSDGRTECTMIGLYLPNNHWIASRYNVQDDTLCIFDSDSKEGGFSNRKRSDFYAGDRRPAEKGGKKLISIDRRVVIAFHKNAK